MFKIKASNWSARLGADHVPTWCHSIHSGRRAEWAVSFLWWNQLSTRSSLPLPLSSCLTSVCDCETCCFLISRTDVLFLVILLRVVKINQILHVKVPWKFPGQYCNCKNSLTFFFQQSKAFLSFSKKKNQTTYQVSDSYKFYLNYYLIHLISLDFSSLLFTFLSCLIILIYWISLTIWDK